MRFIHGGILCEFTLLFRPDGVSEGNIFGSVHAETFKCVSYPWMTLTKNCAIDRKIRTKPYFAIISRNGLTSLLSGRSCIRSIGSIPPSCTEADVTDTTSEGLSIDGEIDDFLVATDVAGCTGNGLFCTWSLTLFASSLS